MLLLEISNFVFSYIFTCIVFILIFCDFQRFAFIRKYEIQKNIFLWTPLLSRKWPTNSKIERKKAVNRKCLHSNTTSFMEAWNPIFRRIFKLFQNISEFGALPRQKTTTKTFRFEQECRHKAFFTNFHQKSHFLSEERRGRFSQFEIGWQTLRLPWRGGRRN